MADKILSAVTYDTTTRSYTNVPPDQAPLLINDNGDLIFNTQNLSLYNAGSNNRILKNDWTPQYTDNVLIGSNNSYIFGQPHTIINSDNVYISGAYLHPDRNTYQQYDSISNSTWACIIDSYGSRLDSSNYSYISGSTWSSSRNSLSTCIFSSCLSTVLGGQYHKINGQWLDITSTGLVRNGSFRGGGATVIGGGTQLCTVEANYDRQRFTGTLGTGWANGNNDSTVYFNCASALLAGNNNLLVTSQQSSIIGGQNNCISGTTNGACVGRAVSLPFGGSVIYTIARWKLNENNSILGSKNSKILDQVSESLILGGSYNCLVARNFPWYYSGIDTTCQDSRVLFNANIVGGAFNTIREGSNCSSIIGSTSSTIESGSVSSTILGGSFSKLCSKSCGSIVQGDSNIINGCYSKIGGGYFNLLSGNYNFIGGGRANRNCTQQYSSMIGGCANWICSGSDYSFIGGGGNHCIINSPYSYVIGGRCSIIQDSHCGAAVLGDGQNRRHVSCGPDTLTLNFAGGVFFAQPNIYGLTNFEIRPKVNSVDILVNGDSNLVYNTGNQTIDGVKNFTSIPQYNSVNLAISNAVVDKTTNQNIGGIKNFTSRPNVNSVPILISGATSQIFTSPVDANSSGRSGQFVIDGDYFYFCKKDNTWVRTALSSW